MTSPAEARALLGVGADASADDVRRAYRRLARHAHPDAGGDAADFHRLQQAVAVLLGPRPRPAPPAASPSTSRMTRPSTSRPMGGTGWGESSGPRWHDGAVAVDGVDWDGDLPDPPHAWSVDLLAIALVAPPEEDAVVRPVAGASRRPGSRLNRMAGWLSADLPARWAITPARSRGVPGHDVEVRLELAGSRARRLADDAVWPFGWTRERRPSTTHVTSVVVPSRDPRATAVRTAQHLADGLDVLGWPLDDWYRLRDTAR